MYFNCAPQFSVGFDATSRYVQRFNLKTWSLDATCIHGVASRRAGHVTVFPHAIAQGATFDVDLVRAMSNITAVEARIVSAQSYFSGGGESALVHASLPSAYQATAAYVRGDKRGAKELSRKGLLRAHIVPTHFALHFTSRATCCSSCFLRER
jgi:hypothetical protein